MDQWSGAPAALIEDPSSMFSINVVAPNHLSLQFQGVRCPFSGLPRHWACTRGAQTTFRQENHTHRTEMSKSHF